MSVLTAVAIGFALDLLFGDPLWLPHPVVGIGRLISGGERRLRRLFPQTPGGEFAAGLLLAAALPLCCCGAGWALLSLCGRLSPLLRLAAESFICYQLLAVKSLADAANAVGKALGDGLCAARQAVGRIVGRDTAALTEEGVIRATVETVAENTGDGVIAPLLFLLLGGAPLGLFYKAINTMDSMIGYQNERYRYFGRAAARLDDAANLLPARLTALLMVAAAGLCGLDAAGALRILRRDRRNHKSPNSAWPEAACAGALGVRLAGDAVYFGETVRKPTIGDATRPIAARDIGAAVYLMRVTAALGLLLLGALRFYLCQ